MLVMIKSKGIFKYLSQFLLVTIIIFLLISTMGCFVSWKEPPAEEVLITAAEPPPVSSNITLTATGDCLMHNTQIWSGEQPNGTYNFDFFFTEVADLIQAGDYCSMCFEAPMAGSETGYTNYPRFNCPDDIADTFKKAGFDLIVTANNHAFDRGYQGAMRTLDVLHNAGLDTIGTYSSEKESKEFLIKEENGTRVGYLAYSYGTNGLPVPSEHRYCFKFLDKEVILSDISELRPQVDILFLILHWGTEYMPEPEPEQADTAHEFLEAGVDVILGSHPHVIQPMEIIRINDQDKMVIYSMGNFISDQHGIERNSGIILNMEFSKDIDTEETRLVKVTYTPTYSHSYYENGKRKFRVVAVEESIKKIMEGQEPYLNHDDIPILEQILESTRSQIGDSFTAADLNDSRV